jgi:antitoxin component YwqK of YwqJK toxin-antitoxin module
MRQVFVIDSVECVALASTENTKMKRETYIKVEVLEDIWNDYNKSKPDSGGN